MSFGFGENLKRLRRQKELTQETLADFLNVSFQTVSKWERGETCPDISMLPVIATFFGVSTDSLLGVDETVREQKIQEYIQKYNDCWHEGRIDIVKKELGRAITEFPGDFRLLVRYFNALLQCEVTEKYLIEIRNEAESIYDRIQNYCTVDSIRIWAKKLICLYYKRLLSVENSGVVLDDIAAILDEMPLMQNSRDYLACTIYPPGEKKTDAVKNAVSELAFLLNGAITAGYNDKDLPVASRIKALETLITVHETLYPDGDYGKNFLNVLYNHGNLSRWYYKTGNEERALIHLRQCVALAVKFDSLPDEIRHTSFLMQGLTIEKANIPFHQKGDICPQIKSFLNNSCGFSDDFKFTEKYQRILSLL